MLFAVCLRDFDLEGGIGVPTLTSVGRTPSAPLVSGGLLGFCGLSPILVSSRLRAENVVGTIVGCPSLLSGWTRGLACIVARARAMAILDSGLIGVK